MSSRRHFTINRVPYVVLLLNNTVRVNRDGDVYFFHGDDAEIVREILAEIPFSPLALAQHIDDVLFREGELQLDDDGRLITQEAARELAQEAHWQREHERAFRAAHRYI